MDNKQPNDLGESLTSLHETLPQLQQSVRNLLGIIEQGESKQPATISAKQFVDEGYAEKVKRGECVVKYQILTVLDIKRHTGKWEDYDLYDVSTDDIDDPFFRVDDETKFTVEWLTPQPVPALATEQGREEKNPLRRLSMLSEQLLNDTSFDLEEAQDTIAELETDNMQLRAALQAATETLAAAERANGVLREALELASTMLDNMTYNLKQSSSYEAKDLIPSLEQILSVTKEGK